MFDYKHLTEEDILIEAISEGNIDQLKKFFNDYPSFNINKNFVHDHYENPLSLACSERELKVIQFLIDKGADVNIIILEDYPLVNLMCSELLISDVWFPVVKILIKNGADINTNNLNNDGFTSLHIMCHNAHCYNKYLINHGANPNIKDNRGKLPIMYTECLNTFLLLLPLVNDWSDIDLDKAAIVEDKHIIERYFKAKTIQEERYEEKDYYIETNYLHMLPNELFFEMINHLNYSYMLPNEFFMKKKCYYL